MKNFQLISIVIFIALAVFGILVFSGAIPLGKGEEPGGLGTVLLWGTIDAGTMSPLLEEFNNIHPAFIIKYEEKDPEDFDRDLLEALATGTGPDLIFLPDNLAFHYGNKIVTIPYQSYPLGSFKNNFAGAGEVFLTSRGLLAFPLTINPIVMYYNRSMMDASGIVAPPMYWDELSKLVPTLTKKDESGKIKKSAVALGGFSNIIHAKEILVSLFMQVGNPIIREQEGVFSSSLDVPNPKYELGSALEFYTDFADPNSSAYSWNKSLANSDDAFSREDLAFYFGFASELPFLINRNSNQNFAVAPFPQVRDANFKLTGAHVLGVAILSASKNFSTAFAAASLMATEDFALKFSEALGVVPARRDLLKMKPTDAYSTTFYDSALFARSWLDPSAPDTENIFRSMVESVLSNSLTIRDAITDASERVNLLLIK